MTVRHAGGELTISAAAASPSRPRTHRQKVRVKSSAASAKRRCARPVCPNALTTPMPWTNSTDAALMRVSAAS